MARPCSTLLVPVHRPAPLHHPAGRGRLWPADPYELQRIPLENFRAVWLSMHCDQHHLATAAAARLERFVRAGGRVVVCGQVERPFLPGLSRFRHLGSARVADLTVHRLAEHPVWQGVDTRDLTFRRGVAGFYGRGGHEPPPGALVVHGLGPARVPLDFDCPLGAGRVLVHGGNDLWGYLGDCGTAARLLPQLLDWSEGGAVPVIGVLEGGTSYHRFALADPGVARRVGRVLYLPELHWQDLDGLRALVVADWLHPGLLRQHAGLLLDFAARGGWLVVLGQVEAHTWVPGARWEPRPTNFWWWLEPGADPGVRACHPGYPLFRQLDPPRRRLALPRAAAPAAGRAAAAGGGGGRRHPGGPAL